MIRFLWLADLKTGTFLANSRESVRVMGVVTDIRDFSSDDQAVSSPLVKDTIERFRLTESDAIYDNKHISSGTKFPQPQRATTSTEECVFSVTVDDGTDSTSFLTIQQTMESPSAPNLEVGKTYDCILKLRQNSEGKLWFAEFLIQIDDPIDEYFRWLELSHHDQSKSRLPSSRILYSNLSHKFGYPTRRRNSAEVYRLIRVSFQLQQEKHQKPMPVRSKKIQNHTNRTFRRSLESQQRKRGLQSISTNTNTNKVPNENPKRRVPHSPATPEPIPVEGLLLKDLATVLQKSERNVQEMIEDLQLEGKIYQNDRGEYLPL